MENKSALSLTSRIREIGNSFIIRKLKEYGLTNLAPSHGDVLFVLYKQDNSTMKDIADKIHRTKATLTVLIDKLEENGFVTREKSSQDNRNTLIALTDKGKKLKPIFEQISKELNDLLYNNFTEEEAYLLDSLLVKMVKNLSIK